jgi:ethanolamine utilization microcompartment shell protein EutL
MKDVHIYGAEMGSSPGEVLKLMTSQTLPEVRNGLNVK